MIAILGGSGFVGKNVVEVLKEGGKAFVTTSLSEGVDLRNLDACINFFEKTQPDYIINCAAHVGSLNYVTEQAANVILDNSRMILSMYEAIAKVCPNAIVINPIANCAYPATAIDPAQGGNNGALRKFTDVSEEFHEAINS